MSHKANIRFKILSIILATLFLQGTAYAQSQYSQNQDGFDSSLYGNSLKDTPERDSTVVQRSVPKDYVQWRIAGNSPYYEYEEPDTLQYLFQNVNKTEGIRSSYNILGNLGSPRLSRLFDERKPLPDFFFDAPYDFFIKNPTDFLFTDTKTPHLNITYFSGGGRMNGDDHIKGYFAANFGRKVGVGFNMDYVYGRGRYSNQATSLFDARFYGYYHGDTYSAHFSFNTDNIKIAENGGITDDRYITNPELMSEGKKEYEPEEIPTNLSDTWNNLNRRQFLIAQGLSISQSYIQSDSVGDTLLTFTKYRELGKIANNTEFGFLERRFITYLRPDNIFSQQWLPNDSLDQFNNFYVRNTLSLSMNEGFSKWAVAGLRLFAGIEYRNYTMPDTATTDKWEEIRHRENEYDFTIGGSIQHETGRHFNLGATAQTVLFGTHFGDFDIQGDVRFNFNLLRQDAGVTIRADISDRTPSYFIKHFHSEHYWWDKEFKKELSTEFEGELHIDKSHTRLTAGFTNIKNYTYMSDNGLPEPANGIINDISPRQSDSDVQVLSASLYQDIVLGVLHWDNRVTWQFSSNQDVLPLPTLDAFSNLYIKFRYARRMDIEFGGEAFWFTKYYAPGYSPVIGEFYTQDINNRIEVGNYPSIDVYLNFVLRSVRFYVMVTHVNSGMKSDTGPFLAPHYPMNPRMFKFGLSWTLFD